MSRRVFPSIAAAALSAGLTASLLVPTTAHAATGPGAAPSAPRAASTAAARRNPVAQHVSWSTSEEFRTGRRRSVLVAKGELKLRRPTLRTLHGRRYESGTWTSPWSTPGYAATHLIPSWEATTTGDALVRVKVRARGANGKVGSWDTVADWALDNPALRRTTYSGQRDDLGRVDVDTWRAATSVSQWQVRVVLLRAPGGDAQVAVQRLGGVASVAYGARATSRPGNAAGTVIPVPRFSQMIHKGHLPRYGGGGEAWCSPTSIAMVLAHHGHRPKAVGVRRHTNAVVDHTARLVYDHGYGGTGNWAFNTAYAATLVDGDSYVTRLRDLRAAEPLIKDGVPLVLSIAFRRGELTGAPISSSNGHLVVLVGFDEHGNPVVNDPAGATNSAVRRTYDRAQFEKIWLNASSGTTYVITDS